MKTRAERLLTSLAQTPQGRYERSESMKTRTEITFEMDRLIVVSRRKHAEWCSTCARPVEMLSVDEAALIAQVNSRTIFRWAESGDLHTSETAAGLLLICPHSPKLTT